MRERTACCVIPLALMWCLASPVLCAAQPVTASERDALVRLRTERGGRAEEVDALIRQASETANKGVPLAPLINKIREGLAKGADPQRIATVIREMGAHLEAAGGLMREIQPAGGADSVSAVTLLAEAFGAGVTSDEVRDLHRQTQSSGKRGSAETIASAAKGLAFIKEAGLPASEAAAVISEAVRQGYRPPDLLDLGREVKRREADYRSGRESLRALREAIARGSRPDQLFRDSRPDRVERPATRPDPITDRPERPTRPETPQRPERPGRQ